MNKTEIILDKASDRLIELLDNKKTFTSKDVNVIRVLSDLVLGISFGFRLNARK